MLRAIPVEPSAPGKMPLSQKCQKLHADTAEKQGCVMFLSYIASRVLPFRERVCTDEAQCQDPVFASCANEVF